MSKIIAVLGAKGGTGKTTTVKTLGEILGEYNRVLCVDMDGQASLTRVTDIKNDSFSFTVYNGLTQGTPTKDIILNTNNGFDLLAAPTDNYLYTFENRKEKPKKNLKAILEEVSDSYDYILIDSPPGAGGLMGNTINASDFVLLVGLADADSLDRIGFFAEFVPGINPDTKFIGFMVNQYSGRTVLDGVILKDLEELGRKYKIPVLSPCVRSSVAVKEALYTREILKKCKPKEDFKEIAKQIINKVRG